MSDSTPYHLKVSVHDVICRDPESVTTADIFAMAGGVVAEGGQGSSFVLPLRRTRAGSKEPLEQVIFEGVTFGPRFGLAFRAWDKDTNRAWIESKAEIEAVEKGFQEAVSHAPIGAAAAAVLTFGVKWLRGMADVFVALDNDDLLVDYNQVQELDPDVGWESPTGQRFEVRFKRDDVTGYSDWDYTVVFSVLYSSYPPSIGTVPKSELAVAQKIEPKEWVIKHGWQGSNPFASVHVMIKPHVGLVRGLLDVTVTENWNGAKTTVESPAVPVSRVVDQNGKLTLERDFEEPDLTRPPKTYSPASGGPRLDLTKPAKTYSPQVTRKHPLTTKLATKVLFRQVGPDLLQLSNNAVLEMYHFVSADKRVQGVQLRYLRPVRDVLNRDSTWSVAVDLQPLLVV